jgi:tripeptidyl-peptidase-1
MSKMLTLLLLLTAQVVHASLHGWKKDVVAPPTDLHTVTFWLTPSNPSALFQRLDDVASPTSPHYRHWLDDDAIASLVSSKALPHLEQWLDDHTQHAYTTDLSKHNDFALVTLNTDDIKQMFGQMSTYHQQNHTVLRLTSGEQLSSTHVPPLLQQHISAIFGLSDFYPLVRQEAMPTTANKDGGCTTSFKGKTINPTVLQAKYNTTTATGPRPGFGKHSQGIAAFEQAEFKPADVAEFQQNFSLGNQVVSIVGPNNGGYFGEASLDTQYIFSIGNGVKTSFIAQDSFNMLEWAWLAMNQTHPPTVLSVSWGSGESGFDAAHQSAANSEFAKIGLKGITIVTASGDAGTGKQGFWKCTKFDPTWPASSPYVTSVGGTYVVEGDDAEETGWGFSGGGFSAFHSRPSYQDVAVQTYVNSGTTLPTASLYNASGRAVPDVSALATNYYLLTAGSWGCLSGTSAATPVFAGLISLINDQLVAQGKPTVGFINPALYGYKGESIGFDVVEGNNKAQGCPAGFNAAKGYDPITGLGTPNYGVLETILAL